MRLMRKFDKTILISKFEVFNGDITQLQVDAIVNAANISLLGGGGVDGAIHRAAGPELLAECRQLNGCETGQAKITKGYKLPAKYVIHTVGPIWNGGAKNETELLKSCYAQSIKLAIENKCKTIAFPAISTGVYNFPKPLAAEIAIKTIFESLEKNKSVSKVIFAIFDSENNEIYTKLLGKYF